MKQIDLIETDKVLNLVLLSDFFGGSPHYIGAGILLPLLFFYCLVSGAEAAFFSASLFQLQQLKESTNRGEKLFAGMLEKPVQFFVTLLLVKFGILFLSFFIMAGYFTPVLNIWQHLLILFGACFLIEFFIKKYAKINITGMARFAGYPMLVLFYLCYPVSILFVWIFGAKMGSTQGNVSLDEISDAIENVDVIDVDVDEQEDAKLLKGVVRFGETVAKEIMRSRSDVIAIEKSQSIEAVLQVILQSGYTRLPVYDEDLDHILGILVFKDFLPYILDKEEFEWHSLMRPAFFISENKMIDELLQEFQKKKIHFAIVVDEYGGTSGIVTLEDVLEEIVGEISDEYDDSDDEIQYKQLTPDTWEFAAKTHIADFCKILNIKDDECFAEVRGDADSLGGLVLELMGRLPLKDEKIRYKNFTFTVSEVDNRRILRLVIHIMEANNPNDHEKDEK